MVRQAVAAVVRQAVAAVRQAVAAVVRQAVAAVRQAVAAVPMVMALVLLFHHLLKMVLLIIL